MRGYRLRFVLRIAEAGHGLGKFTLSSTLPQAMVLKPVVIEAAAAPGTEAN
jgi:hypothetical protein